MKKTLDICMIVKNEENNLKLTLPNFVACADNVIVVDTGSSDKTKEIAVSLGAKVFDYEWADDFSAARNYSFEKSSADWILWLDADEYIELDDFKKIRALIDKTSANLIRIPIHECKYGSKESTGFYYRDKLFKHNLGAHFIRPINEQLIFPEGAFVKEITIDKINIYHWGKFLHDSAMDQKNKERIKLYEAASNGNPSDPLYLYLAATKYEDLGDIKEAVKLYDKVIEICKGRDKLAPLKEAAHIQKAWKLLKLGDQDGAYKEANYFLETNKENIEPYCVIAQTLLDAEKFEKALETFKVAIDLPIKSHPIFGCRDFYWNVMRYSQYANCLFNLGRLEKALLYFKKLYESYKENSIAKIIELLEKELAIDRK